MPRLDAPLMQHSVLVLDPDRTVQWANGEAAELLGWEAEDLCGKPWDVFCPAPPETFSPTNNDFIDAVLNVVGGREQERNGFSEFRNKTGIRVPVEWQVTVNREGQLARGVVTFRSVVTEQATAQRSDNRDVFEHAVAGMFRSSIDGDFLEVNPSFARICRYSSPQEVVRALRDINTQFYVDPSRRAQFVQVMREQGFVNDFESEIRCGDGSIIWIAEYARMVRDAAGCPIYFEGSVIGITTRKEAEEALRRNEEKFRRLLEVAHILPWEADLQTGRFTYVGPQARSLLGFAPEAWLQEGFWLEHVHPDDREWVSLTRAEAVERRQSLEFEYRMISADQRIVWLHEIMSIVSGGGQPPLLGGFTLDITHRRETEESLRESKYLIEQIASASPVILYVFDLQSREVIYLTGRVLEILGYSKTELSMMNPLFIIALAHPGEVEEHAAHFARLQSIHPDEIAQREFRLRNAEGDWVWLSSRETVFKYDKTRGAQEIIGTASDITQRREAMEELRANEALFRKLAETTKVIPFEVDLLSGRFTYVGPQAEQLLGYPTSAWFQPGFWSSLVHPDYVRAAHVLTPASFELEGDFQAEFPLRRIDGCYVWVRQMLNRAAEAHERGHARGFLFDISDAKEVEQERERSRHLLRELATRSQGVREQERINLARELHDEMGQSLTLLRLDIAWLSKRFTKLTPAKRAVEPIQAKLASMEQMLHDTLQTVRRIISSLRPPVLDELGLAEAIQWQASEFARRVGIRCEVAADAVDPLSDDVVTCVFRIFQEILTNVARHAHATRVEVKLFRTNGQLLLRVSDNGRGFIESQTANGKSFGLLGIRERAWALGGSVEIDAAPGRGTTVLLGLPINVAPAESEQANAT